MLKYMTRADFALTTGVRYRYDEQNYLVISVFDSVRNKKLTKYYFIVVEREDTTVEQYIVVVDDSRCEVHETSYGNAIPRALKSIGLTMNQEDDTDLNLYYNAYSQVKVGDMIDKDRVIHIGECLSLFNDESEVFTQIRLDCPDAAQQLSQYGIVFE